MVDRRTALSIISSWDHCQRFSPSQISNTSRAGFEPAQNLSSGFAEGSCAELITTNPRRRCNSTTAILMKRKHLLILRLLIFKLLFLKVQSLSQRIICYSKCLQNIIENLTCKPERNIWNKVKKSSKMG